MSSDSPAMTQAQSEPGDNLQYQIGFGNEHESEALPGALPLGQATVFPTATIQFASS